MTDFEVECATARPYIESKRRCAVLWISKFVEHRDDSGRANACLALGRLIGAVEMIEARARTYSPVPQLPEDFKRIINETFEFVWPELNGGGDPLAIPECWRIITPV